MLSMRAYEFHGRWGEALQEMPIPDDVMPVAEQARTELIEKVWFCLSHVRATRQSIQLTPEGDIVGLNRT